MAKSKVAKYHDMTRPMMSFVHGGMHFHEGHVFSQAELLAVTPERLMEYLLLKIYHNSEANPDVDPPLFYRTNTIKSWKKAWSYFMLNRNVPWNEVARQGNPTRCTQICGLIKAMKKMETARRGVPSNARRAFTSQEYEQIIELATSHQNDEIGTWLAAFNAVQFNLIGRVDDTAKLRAPDLQPFQQFENYGITGRLCWSKNVMEERDAPTQILFGAMDWRYCALSNLAPWLEHHFTLNPEDNEYYFGIEGKDDPDSIKSSAAHHLKVIFEDEGFNAFLDGLMGTHSLRKFAVNTARRNGCSKDDTDHRGRWKGDSRQQDVYADTTIPYVDAKVAAALCKGGPVAFLPKEELGITDQWVLDYVVPHLPAHLPRQVCVVLGRALLWKIFHSSGQHLPAEIRNRVMSAYRDLPGIGAMEPGENPVLKIPLGVAGIDSELIIDEILGGNDGNDGAGIGNGGNGNGDHRASNGLHRQEVRLLSSQVLHLRRELSDSIAELERRDAIFRSKLTRLNTNVSRLAAAPGRRSVASAGARGVEDEPPSNCEPTRRVVASLGARPKTLHDLWHEYTVGASGKKPARDFNEKERGKVKTKYCYRLKFWEKCDELVRGGLTADVACDRIYQAYGARTSVTKILIAMKKDKQRGQWPPCLHVQQH
jgi:hypothetical protein